MPRTNFSNERLDNLQGDLPSDGFMKRYETYYFFTIAPGHEDKFNKRLTILADSKLLSNVLDSRTSRVEVIKAKQIAHEKGEPSPEKDMVNALIAFSMKGLQKIETGLSQKEKEKFNLEQLRESDPAFANGMANDKELNDPDQKDWDPLFNTGQIDGILKIAGNPQKLIDERLEKIKKMLEFITDIPGISLPTTQSSRVDGQVRPKPNNGKEHYGFQDGVSQPLVIGLNTKDDIKKNLTMVVGRERLLVTKDFNMVQVRGKFPPAKPALRPEWMVDGTFLVFRKLDQNVKAFQELTSRHAKVGLETPGHLGAKLMGRWPSGAPVIKFDNEDKSNPEIAIHKENAHSEGDEGERKTYDNDWYFEDTDGKCPYAAHIRKTHTRSGSRASGLTPIVRSGIPYGSEYKSGTEDEKRGLLFACYQSSIENGFRFIQTFWSNEPNFPGDREKAPPGPKGYDPIIGQPLKRVKMFTTLYDKDNKPIDSLGEYDQLTTMKGGEYFFVPTFEMLRTVFGLKSQS